jgi:hypothetical protein
MTVEGFSYKWDALEGPTALVADVKFPRRIIRSFQPSPRDRVLSWAGRAVSPFLLPDALQTLVPSVVVGVAVGAGVSRRMASLNGACLIPAGASVEIALDSPRYSPSIAAKAARYFRICAGTVDFVLGDTSAGSFVDRVSLQVPIIADNAVLGESSLTCVTFDQVSGYSRYRLRNCSGAYLLMSQRGQSCPVEGNVQQDGFVQLNQTNDASNDILAGYSVTVPSCTGYPAPGVNIGFYTGQTEQYRAGTLSFE